MELSCECSDEVAPEPGDTIYQDSGEYSELVSFRSKRCSSCNDLIKPRATVVEFLRFKIPDYDIEFKIYGEEGEMPRASHYLCERCADLFFSLTELGFCVDIHEDQRELVKEYAVVYGSNGTYNGTG